MFFTVKIHPLTLTLPLGGEGMIFMSGGDQIQVMMVCDSKGRRGGARAHENTP